MKRLLDLEFTIHMNSNRLVLKRNLNSKRRWTLAAWRAGNSRFIEICKALLMSLRISRIPNLGSTNIQKSKVLLTPKLTKDLKV
jgi:hypothetical protein